MVIMMAIPFGFVGAVIGHEIMGYSLSIISVFGIIALSGVVINAGIVMMDYANKARARRDWRPICRRSTRRVCGGSGRSC